MIKLIKRFINKSLTDCRTGAHRAYIQLDYMLYNRDFLLVLYSTGNFLIVMKSREMGKRADLCNISG